MPKIRPEDLQKIKERMAKTMHLREGDAQAKITVHMGTCGIAAGARKIMSTLMVLHEKTERKDIILTTSGCAGLCKREPMATVQLGGEAPIKYVDLTPEEVGEIFVKHVLGGDPVSDYALAVGSERLS